MCWLLQKASAFSSDMGFSQNMSLQKHGGLFDKEIWREMWKAWPTIELRPLCSVFISSSHQGEYNRLGGRGVFGAYSFIFSFLHYSVKHWFEREREGVFPLRAWELRHSGLMGKMGSK